MKTLRSKTKEMMQLAGACLAIFLLTKCTDAKTSSEAENGKTEIKTAIHSAAFMGDVDAIKAHIKAGTDLNQKDQYGSSPLTIAATFGKEAAAIELINGGADLNVKSADGSTPLHTASFFCRTSIVKALLEKGADRTLKNNFGATPLESVSVSFEDVKMIYDQISRDLGPFGLKLDYDHLKKTRPVIANMIESYQ